MIVSDLATTAQTEPAYMNQVVNKLRQVEAF